MESKMSKNKYVFLLITIVLVFTMNINAQVNPSEDVSLTLSESSTHGYDNIALGKKVGASSIFAAAYPGENAVDGNMATVWGSSVSTVNEWIYVDLGSVQTIDGLGMFWFDKYYPKKYDIYISPDAFTWTKVAGITKTNNQADQLYGTGTTRYIGLLFIDKNAAAIGLTEFEVYKAVITPTPTPGHTFTVIDTGQTTCYDDTGQIINPAPGEPYYGQDAHYTGTVPRYTDNGDGTITDNNTGLMWQKGLLSYKPTYDQAVAEADTFTLAGYSDWRLPTIKELYSLIDFTGKTGMSAADSIPFIDTDYFEFRYGDEDGFDGRFIDSQYASCTEYVSTTMNGDFTIFGVNFADGRIKGYGATLPNGSQKDFEVKYVRGALNYGVNDFVDNGDGTITDRATGLMWMQVDSGHLGAGGLNWEQALDWAENLTYAGYSDWRLPDTKELQGIVDYTRSPDTTNSAAIDPLFQVTSILDEGNNTNYPFYWTGTTHKDGLNPGDKAAYIAFGEALGWMQPPFGGDYTLLDVHGTGCQRSDPKSGDPADYPYGHGPQGDVIRIYNYVRCVRYAE